MRAPEKTRRNKNLIYFHTQTTLYTHYIHTLTGHSRSIVVIQSPPPCKAPPPVTLALPPRPASQHTPASPAVARPSQTRAGAACGCRPEKQRASQKLSVRVPLVMVHSGLYLFSCPRCPRCCLSSRRSGPCAWQRPPRSSSSRVWLALPVCAVVVGEEVIDLESKAEAQCPPRGFRAATTKRRWMRCWWWWQCWWCSLRE